MTDVVVWMLALMAVAVIGAAAVYTLYLICKGIIWIWRYRP